MELEHAQEMAAHQSPRTIKRSSSMTAPKSASQKMRWRESGIFTAGRPDVPASYASLPAAPLAPACIPAENRRFSTCEGEFLQETGSHVTLCWREEDSNRRSLSKTSLRRNREMPQSERRTRQFSYLVADRAFESGFLHQRSWRELQNPQPLVKLL